MNRNILRAMTCSCFVAGIFLLAKPVLAEELSEEPVVVEEVVEQETEVVEQETEVVEVETEVETQPVEDVQEEVVQEEAMSEEAKAEENLINYSTHVQNDGWQKEVSDGDMSGTSGKSLRLEGIKIELGKDVEAEGGVEYKTHIQDIGWESDVKKDGEMSGTTGKALRLEGIQIRLYGEVANLYDIYYRVHAQEFGWLDWAKNFEMAGSQGYAYRLEAIEIKLIKKDGEAPGSTKAPFKTKSGYSNHNYVKYETHVQTIGWQGEKYDGVMSGTTGKALRLEGIKIEKADEIKDVKGDIIYKTHIQDLGWEEDFVKNGKMSGTSGKALRLEAIQIDLTEDLKEQYDIYYRVHAQQYGWLGWAKNGEDAGTQGYAYRLEGIEIQLVAKGEKAPGSTKNAFVFDKAAYINSKLPSNVYLNYYTDESVSAYKETLNKAKDKKYINNLDRKELDALASEVNEAANNLQYKVGTSAPVVYVTTKYGNGNSIQKADGYVKTNIAVVDTKGKVIDESGQIKVRGNSTARGAKKPYGFKFDSKQNVLGMGKAKKWVLLANLFDPTGLRNSIAFDLAQELGIEYTSEHELVEVYMDGKYKGVYLLAEPVEEGKTRVNIDLDAGEFILERESVRVEDDTTYLTAGNEFRFSFKEPDEPTSQQVKQATKVMNNIVNLMKNGSYEDLSKAIDIDSFAKFYLLHEFVKTRDIDFSSVYFYYKGGKLYAGPVWDNDLALGNQNNDQLNGAKDPKGNYLRNFKFYKYLLDRPEFRDKVRTVYKDHSAYFENITAEGGLIDQYTTKYADILEKNEKVAGWKSSSRYSTLSINPASTLQENVEVLSDWIESRNIWLANHYGNHEGLVNYTAKISSEGWLRQVSDGTVSGSTSESKRLKKIVMKLSDELNGDIYYTTYVQNKGWQEWAKNGEESGNDGNIVGLAVQLKNEVADQYDVYYQVHVSNVGWMDWKKNGEVAGSNLANTIEAIRVKLVEKTEQN